MWKHFNFQLMSILIYDYFNVCSSKLFALISSLEFPNVVLLSKEEQIITYITFGIIF